MQFGFECPLCPPLAVALFSSCSSSHIPVMFARLSRRRKSPFLASSSVGERLDEAVILLHQVIEVLHLSQLTAFGEMSFRFHFRESFGIGRVFIDVDHAWRARMRGGERFQKEVLGGFS